MNYQNTPDSEPIIENELVADALHYAKSGLLVFPLHAVKDGRCTCAKSDCNAPAKHPRTIHGLKQATCDLQSVKNLFSSFTYASANIGICTGKESNLVVVDIDSVKGGRIEELYEFVPKEILEKTLRVKTGGGSHMYFLYPETSEISNSVSKLGNKIDVRGGGGYVVAPPSMHITGKQYEFLNDNEILPLPKEFIEKLNRIESKTENIKQLKKTNGSEFYPEGSRNDSLASVAGKLRHAGLNQSEIETSLIEINSERCKPPLEAKEVSQIARSIARYDIGKKTKTVSTTVKETNEFPSLFDIQAANKWIEDAKKRPVPKMLFGQLWYEGELCILFADTGKGKSILAVQIANAISSGLSIKSFPLGTKRQPVLYLDFELSDKQFEARYSTKNGDYFTNHYVFDENFKRGEINQDSVMPEFFKDYEEYLYSSLEFEIARTNAKVLIVDNITFLKNATETAKDALPLMKALIRLKKKFKLSILALAHTPKRDLTKPLSVNDLQGSKMLSNFADSIFAIGESAEDKNLRYIKQIKARNTEIIYDRENVATCQVIKLNNFLMFEFLTFGSENEHLKTLNKEDKENLIQKVKSLSAHGKSQRQIAEELSISLSMVNRLLKK